MSKFETYSQEWKEEMEKLPKQVIIEMFCFMAQDKDKNIDQLVEINAKMLDLLTKDLSMLLSGNNTILKALSALLGKEFSNEVNQENTSK